MLIIRQYMIRSLKDLNVLSLYEFKLALILKKVRFAPSQDEIHRAFMTV